MFNSSESQKKEKDPDYEYEIINGVLTKVPRKEPLSIEKDYQDYRYDKTWANTVGTLKLPRKRG